MTKRPDEKIIAWQEAYKLCILIYKITADFPNHETFGLRSQIRRASYSVVLNIVEGNRKKSKKEKIQFFERSAASLEESHCAAKLSLDLCYITDEQYTEIDSGVNRTSYLLIKLINSYKESFTTS